MLTYSPRWGEGVSCAVMVDGQIVTSSETEGIMSWKPRSDGLHTLVHSSGNEVYTAYFNATEDTNRRPVIFSESPQEVPELVFPGETLTFSVSASDIDGDELSYIWLIDGVTNSVNTTGMFTWTPLESDGGVHRVSCHVADGFWTTPPERSWTVNVPKWYVTPNGVSLNTGTSASSPFGDLQSAVNVASDGEVVLVAEGTYAPVSTSNKRIRIVASGSLDKTIIDGGGSNRCVYVGANEASTNTVVEGFTLKNGYYSGNHGGGVMGGTYKNCIIKNCSTK